MVLIAPFSLGLFIESIINRAIIPNFVGSFSGTLVLSHIIVDGLGRIVITWVLISTMTIANVNWNMPNGGGIDQNQHFWQINEQQQSNGQYLPPIPLSVWNDQSNWLLQPQSATQHDLSPPQCQPTPPDKKP
jgi:hypothetical protein